MSSSSLLYPTLQLYHTPDQYLISHMASAGGTQKRRYLILDRISGELSISEETANAWMPPASIDRVTHREEIDGVLGLAQLVSGPHLVVVAKKTRIGDVSEDNHAVFRVDAVKVLPFARSLNHLTDRQQQENRTFLAMLHSVLSTPAFYFSYTTDLSRTLQSKSAAISTSSSSATKEFDVLEAVTKLYTLWDDRFVWNRFLLEPFLARGAEFLRYCLPIIHGALFIRQCSINGRLFRWTLMSRRSNRRAGTRYFVRGCDAATGDCANFVETEQIVEHADVVSSFVMTRGSIPLVWSQYPNMRHYKPDFKLSPAANQVETFVLHMSEHTARYGQTVTVNLINQTHREGEMERQLRSVHASTGMTDVAYVPFDFNAVCGRTRWDKLSLLIKELKTAMTTFGCLMRSSQSGTFRRQLGAFRINCIDSLDRTNIVQSLVAAENLEDVLLRLGVLREGQKVLQEAEFGAIFRHVWADHGDVLAVQYAGTGALKGDFTRTGKRTFQGLLQDGQNAAVRFYKNNFTDGYRQDALDLFLGNYNIGQHRDTSSYYADPSASTSWSSYLPAAFAICIALTLLTFTLSAEIDLSAALFMLFCMAAAAGIGSQIYKNAEMFVDMPKLKKLE